MECSAIGPLQSRLAAFGRPSQLTQITSKWPLDQRACFTVATQRQLSSHKVTRGVAVSDMLSFFFTRVIWYALSYSLTSDKI
jgi:hypothetical protein